MRNNKILKGEWEHICYQVSNEFGLSVDDVTTLKSDDADEARQIIVASVMDFFSIRRLTPSQKSRYSSHRSTFAKNTGRRLSPRETEIALRLAISGVTSRYGVMCSSDNSFYVILCRMKKKLAELGVTVNPLSDGEGGQSVSAEDQAKLAEWFELEGEYAEN